MAIHYKAAGCFSGVVVKRGSTVILFRYQDCIRRKSFGRDMHDLL